jgi:hypothetical protein
MTSQNPNARRFLFFPDTQREFREFTVDERTWCATSENEAKSLANYIRDMTGIHVVVLNLYQLSYIRDIEEDANEACRELWAITRRAPLSDIES